MKDSLVLIHTLWRSALYVNRRLLMQTDEAGKGFHARKPEYLDSNAFGPIRRYFCVDYHGILPDNLDDVKEPVWDARHKKILGYRKVC